jgi:hypothetical protein
MFLYEIDRYSFHIKWHPEKLAEEKRPLEKHTPMPRIPFFLFTFCYVKEPVAPAEADHQGKEKPVFDQVENKKNFIPKKKL